MTIETDLTLGMSYREAMQTHGLSLFQVRKIARTLTIPPELRRRGGRKPVTPPPQLPFVAFDGESINDKYVLLANSDGGEVYNKKGLTTLECLEFLSTPVKGIPVWFAGNYDIHHVIKDFDIPTQKLFLASEPVSWGDYKLTYYPKKILTVKRGDTPMMTYYDSWGFFGCSFEQACKDILGELPDLIVYGKYYRARFDLLPIGTIKKYNLTECKLLAQMMSKVREAVTFDIGDIHVRPNRWHGPGAVASALLKKIPAVKAQQKIEDEWNPKIQDAIRRAYFGGRIELLKLGRQENIYAYDINSAYPSAIAECPKLSAKWSYTPHPKTPLQTRSAIYHVEYDLRGWLDSKLASYPGPFPQRSRIGYITFGAIGRVWVWADELLAAWPTYGKHIKLLGAYHQPYVVSDLGEIVNAIYTKRREYKAAGDMRQLGLKLALNSMYGKFAQTRGTGVYRVVSYAGFITANCRSKLLAAALQSSHSIIGFATDSIYSTRPLDLPISKKMGEWEASHYKKAIWIQPGLACLTDDTDIIHDKARGFRPRSVPRPGTGDIAEDVKAIYAAKKQTEGIEWGGIFESIKTLGYAEVDTPIFVGHGLANAQPNAYGDKRLKITTTRKKINPTTQTKRDYNFALGDKLDLENRSYGSGLVSFIRDEKDGGRIVDSYPPSALIPEGDADIDDAMDTIKYG